MTNGTPKESYDFWTETNNWVGPAYFIGGPPWDFCGQAVYTLIAVINLKTGVLMGSCWYVGSNDQKIVDLVTEANQ